MAPQKTIFKQSHLIGTRLLCLAGAVFTASIILLALYPGLFTLVAIPVLPAPFLFLAVAIYPALVHKQGLRFYLIGSLVIVALSWIYEFWWLHYHLRTTS